MKIICNDIPMKESNEKQKKLHYECKKNENKLMYLK